MAEEHTISVYDAEGKHGILHQGVTQEGYFGVMVRIELEDGCVVMAPAERLRLREDGAYALPWRFAELERCDEQPEAHQMPH
ncbi:MAG: hypothetical protein ACYC4R_03005 [Anaerolineae bacterium]